MDLGIRGLGPGVRIGAGASATVYRARQEQLGRDVAVKLLNDRDPSFVRRFQREALALGRLSRLPGIVTVYDSGVTDEGEPYLVLEHCPSSLLDHLRRHGTLAPAEAVHLVGRVAATLAQAHQMGIVHRDLKPANILLSPDGEPLVADLGMASVLGAGLTHSIGFTPGFAAPEILQGQAGGAEVDVYALGATLFQLVSGRVAFLDPANGHNLVALALAVQSQPVEDLRPAGVPDGLCTLIEAAMVKDPDRRPTAAALAQSLADLAGTVAAPSPTAPSLHLPAGRGHRRPWPWRTVGAVAGSVAAIGATAALLLTTLPDINIDLGGETSAAASTVNFPAEPTKTSAVDSPTTGVPATTRAPASNWLPSADDTIASLAAERQQWDEARAGTVAALSDRAVLRASRPSVKGCPATWSNVTGIDDTAVDIELRVPLGAGPDLVDTQARADGFMAYFDWVNAQGGIGPDHLQVAIRYTDTAGEATSQGDEPFAVASFDPEPNLTAADELNVRCIPEPMVVSPHPALADTAMFPWTSVGPSLGLRTEAALWVSLIERRLGFDPDHEIVVVTSPDDIGTLYRQALLTAVGDRSIGSIVDGAEWKPGTGPPDAVIVMSSADACPGTVSAAGGAAADASLRILSSACGTNDAIDEAQRAGWVSTRDAIRLSEVDAGSYVDPGYLGDDAFSQLIDEQLLAADLDPDDPATRQGFGLYGWLWQQSLEIAAALPGGLTRTNLVAAQRNLSGLLHPMLHTGVTLNTRPGDPWPVEASEVTRWEPGSGQWLIEEIIDGDGQTPACRWDLLSRSCQPPG